MPSLQRIIEEAAKIEKKKNIVLIIRNVQICKEFVTSLSDLLLCAKKYTISTHMTDSDHFDEATRRFCDQKSADFVVFVQSTVGFGPGAIETLVDDAAEVGEAHVGIAVPLQHRTFHRLSRLLKTGGEGGVDEREIESLTSNFDIRVKNNTIQLDDRGRFECDGFQPHDIVCVPLASMRGGVRSPAARSLLHTTFTTSNLGARGCLLDHLRRMESRSDVTRGPSTEA